MEIWYLRCIVQRLLDFTVNRWPCFISCTLMFVTIETRPVYHLEQANESDYACHTGKKSSLPPVSHSFALLKVNKKNSSILYFRCTSAFPIMILISHYRCSATLNPAGSTSEPLKTRAIALLMTHDVRGELCWGGNEISLQWYGMFKKIQLNCTSCRRTIKENKSKPM